MIICLDTNVFVSGVLWKGPPSRILELWIDGVIEVVVSSEILMEYELVLGRFVKRVSWELLSVWIEFSKAQSRLVSPSDWPGTSCRDPADIKFLTCALEGHADYIITGDKDLLSLKQEFPFKILRPATFLKELF